MDILGIGPSELLFIIIIALIVLGPKDMQQAGKTIGRWLNNLVRSEGWQTFQQTSREIRDLPAKLMREANMELAEAEKELRKTQQGAAPRRPLPQPTSNSIRPPQADPPPQPPPASANNATEPNEKTS